MMNEQDSNLVMNAACHAIALVQEAWQCAGYDAGAPSAIFKPRIFIDGNMWCALYGENLQDGVAGFGSSPALAMKDFDTNWNRNRK